MVCLHLYWSMCVLHCCTIITMSVCLHNTQMPHISTMRVRYGVSVVNSKSENILGRLSAVKCYSHLWRHKGWPSRTWLIKVNCGGVICGDERVGHLELDWLKWTVVESFVEGWPSRTWLIKVNCGGVICGDTRVGHLELDWLKWTVVESFVETQGLAI